MNTFPTCRFPTCLEAIILEFVPVERKIWEKFNKLSQETQERILRVEGCTMELVDYAMDRSLNKPQKTFPIQKEMGSYNLVTSKKQRLFVGEKPGFSYLEYRLDGKTKVRYVKLENIRFNPHCAKINRRIAKKVEEIYDGKEIDIYHVIAFCIYHIGDLMGRPVLRRVERPPSHLKTQEK